MSLDETLFIGNPTISAALPLDRILEHYAIIRDAIATTEHIVPEDLPGFVVNQSFVYAFNSYKAISLLLPQLYHESAAAVVRQLWEVSLNLHWVGIDTEKRSRDFSNYTVMEYRKLLSKADASHQIDDFDKATKRFQERFRYQDKRGRNRSHGNFAMASIHDRATELGEPWESEYTLVYHLTSMHAHGAPGAVLHAMFQASYPNPERLENNSASLIAILAVKVMVRNVELLHQLGVIPDASSIRQAFRAFEATIKTEPEGSQ
ncbi:DUF5677 domain-containing protein [Marinobacter apostichopi]|uniref:DUF5677 domain-containing protein n=1 Tax=Marinobacter apostichopi TaxID=3035454 RepID=UPI0025726F8B|nr:DUF5677 domain-containing protein [Marinobacter sp. LA51]